MIYTVTLNPSIDYVVHLKAFRPGLTNRTTAEEYYIGGKGVNVSRVLAELGIRSTALGFVAGFTGEAIEKGMAHDRIRSDFIHLSKGLSRINLKILTDCESEINCQGPDIGPDDFARLLAKTDSIADGDTLILAGSIPDSLGNDAYVRILEHLKGKKIRVAVDATGRLLTATLKYKPFLIKPNRQELAGLFMKEIRTREDIIDCARELKKMGAQNVLVSLGHEGALLLDEHGAVHHTGVLKDKVRNTVGAGDSMVAGFIAGYEQSGDYEKALLLGSACGNATAFSPQLACKDEIIHALNRLLEQQN